MSYQPPGGSGTPNQTENPTTNAPASKPQATVPSTYNPAIPITSSPYPNIAALYPNYQAQYPPGAVTYKPPTTSSTGGSNNVATNATPTYPPPLQGQHPYAQSYFAHTPYAAYPAHATYLNSPAPGTPGGTMAHSPYPYPSILPAGATPYAAAYSVSPQVKTHGKLALPSVVPSPSNLSGASAANTVAPTNAATTINTSSVGLSHGLNTPKPPTTTSQPQGQNVATTTAGRPGRKPTSFKGAFAKDLRPMMYGFGDDIDPATDTVNVMEEILMEYITDVCAAAQHSSRKSAFKLEDLRRVLSRPADAKKLARLEELLFMQEDIKRARAQFETDDPVVGAAVSAVAKIGPSGPG